MDNFANLGFDQGGLINDRISSIRIEGDAEVLVYEDSRYRGRVPVNWAVLHGERETGATLHRMVEKPDAGEIVAQQPDVIAIAGTEAAAIGGHTRLGHEDNHSLMSSECSPKRGGGRRYSISAPLNVIGLRTRSTSRSPSPPR